MPRVDDIPFPTIGGERPSAPTLPVDLYIGLARQPVSAYVWDDYTATYDDPTGAFIWDDFRNWPYERFDLFCKAHGLTITTGTTNPDGVMEAGHVEMTLDNRDGSLSQYDAAGRLVDWVPGSPLDIWVVHDGVGYWLFSGFVTAWRERQDETIEVEAFDAFTILNEEVPEWDPGNYGDAVIDRLTKICAAHGYTGRTRFDHGAVTLHSFLTTATPLEEMKQVALSDGGIVGVDADGTLLYVDRNWVTGRDDQPSIPMFSDNYCDAPFHVWDAQMTTDDEVITNRATLTSLGDVTVAATNQRSVDRYGPQSIARTGEQWIDADDGQELANYLVTRRGDAYLRLEQFALYLHDRRQDLWPVGLDRRLGDIVTWIHEQPSTTGVNLMMLNLVVQSIVHDITPETWITTIGTTRTVGNTVALRWDRTSYRWDDPGAVYAL